MHRETFIAKLTEVQQTVEELLTQLQASEHDKFAAHLYPSRREYRSACQRLPLPKFSFESHALGHLKRRDDTSLDLLPALSGSTCCALETRTGTIPSGHRPLG
jgi:hypothetical protein